jgi:hypothetical protein
MNIQLHELCSRIHDKARRYFYFDIARWTKNERDMFFGATDALPDSYAAAESYARSLQFEDRSNGHGLLVCYGFLQALYIQQDAIKHLSCAVGLSWRPESDAKLKRIRTIRNRAAGHPDYA